MEGSRESGSIGLSVTRDVEVKCNYRAVMMVTYVAYVHAIIFPRYFWSIKVRSDIRTLIFHGYLSFVFF